MAVARRSRIVEGSCWGCRRRRVKCDLQQPSCMRCHSSGQSCDYSSSTPIKWVGGMALRGRHAPPRKTPDAPESPLTVPLDESALVLYFDNAVLPRFQLLEQRLPLDLNLVMKDQSFQRTIIAVSRAHHHLALNPQRGNSELVRKQARHNAIQSLRHRLEMDVDSQQTAQQLFTINVLLCMLDGMIEPSDESNASTCHLKGGFAMLNRWPEIPVEILAKKGLEAHLLSLFATMDLVHAILSGDKPFFQPLMWYMFSHVQAWWGILPKNHRFLSLLKTYAEMACLGNLVCSRQPSNDGLLIAEKCIPNIEAALEDQQQQQQQFKDETADDDDRDDDAADDSSSDDHQRELGIVVDSPAWRIFCDLYEVGGKIYILRALQQRPMNDEAVQKMTRKGIELLLDVRLPGMMAHCVILPVLIIGSHCTQAEDRRAISKSLEASASHLAFRNLSIMADVLRDMWAQCDVNASWWSNFASLSDKTFTF